MKSRRWLWLLILFTALCAAFITFLSFQQKGDGRVLVVQDALDPLADILEPYAETGVERLNPYRLGHALPGLDGMAFVFSTQTGPYSSGSDASGYVPLYSATVVIAVNRSTNEAGAIDGWHSLLDSGATVLMPHNATEGGRLATSAMALGLGAEPGDFAPALEALSALNAQGRLNIQDEYAYDGYNYMFHPERLSEYDAVVLWDYQARTLMRMQGGWEMVIPSEGVFTVNCGFVYGGSAGTDEDLVRLRAFLLSEQGAQALEAAGFSPISEETDLSGWDFARLTYNPEFRRNVLSVKLYAPASVLERLLLQSAVLLLFCIVSQRVLRRIPRGACRTASIFAILFCALWLLIGIAKTLSLHHDPARFWWFTTYIPRHFLPICWYAMCYANRYDALPPRKKLMGLGFAAVLLCLFVFTNDLHGQMFRYTYENPATWGNHYENGWGYYLSLFWSLSLAAAGFHHIFRNKMTHRQKRQMIYTGIFFALLILYQSLYMAGLPYVIDLDIPAVVALFFLVFNLAAQRERFMGASLLELPIFQHSPYAIAVYDVEGRAIWKNRSMTSLKDAEAQVSTFLQGDGMAPEILLGGLTFRSRAYTFETGRALVLEDITELTRLEQSLRLTQKKLRAVSELLIRQTETAGSLIGTLEREQGSKQMEELFFGKLAETKRGMNEIAHGGYRDERLLRRVRFLICICQRRLRFILQSLQARFPLPAELLEKYVSGVVEDGKRFGLDGVVSGSSDGTIPSALTWALLECTDHICLYAFDFPGCSLVCRMETAASGITLFAALSWEDDRPLKQGEILPLHITDAVSSLGGGIFQETEEDGITVRLTFPCGEVRK